MKPPGLVFGSLCGETVIRTDFGFSTSVMIWFVRASKFLTRHAPLHVQLNTLRPMPKERLELPESTVRRPGSSG